MGCRSTLACATGGPTFPKSSSRCALTALMRPQSSAWLRKTLAPASACIAEQLRPKPRECVSISHPDGPIIRCSRRHSLSDCDLRSIVSPQKLVRRSRSYLLRTAFPAALCKLLQRVKVSHVCGLVRESIPTQKTPSTRRTWLQRACLKLLAGGLHSRARARAAARG